MRATAVTAAALCGAVFGAGCATAAPVGSPAGITRKASFMAHAAALEQEWNTDVREGVAASGLAPLRQELARSSFDRAPAASSIWVTGDGSALLTSLHRQTALIWNAAVARARQSADEVITAWTAMAAQYGTGVPAGETTAAEAWPAQLANASTPAAFDALAASWSSVLTSARGIAAAADALSASLSPYGGIAGLIAAGLNAEFGSACRTPRRGGRSRPAGVASGRDCVEPGHHA